MQKDIVEKPYEYTVVVSKSYNERYGDDRICKCGNVYFDHFTTWREVSSTANGCFNFAELQEGDINPKDAIDVGFSDARAGKDKDQIYLNTNVYVRDAYEKGYSRGSESEYDKCKTMDETDIASIMKDIGLADDDDDFDHAWLTL